MHSVRIVRPINEKRSVGIFFRAAPQLYGLVPDDLDPVGGGLRFEKRFERRRRFNHSRLCKRKPFVDKWVEPIGKSSHHCRFKRHN